MAVNELPDRRRTGRRFFIFVAALFPLVVLAGFARTYYLKGFFDAPPLPSMLVQLHGAVMTAWILLFVTQVWLISSRRVKVHQKLGSAGVVLGAIIVVVGILTGIAGAQRGAAPGDIPPLSFMIVPLGDMVIFGILFGAAIYYRKKPANHKRLMLLTIMNFLPPAIGRLPFDAITAAGPLAFFGIPDLLTIIFVAVDTWKNGKLNKVFALGALLLIASHPLRIVLSGTDTWLRFATWITS
jgi:hypothetical protein